MDRVTEEKRGWIMSRIRARDTVPELVIRSMLHRAGLRFRLYAKDLPGKPDLKLTKYRTVVEIRGCFWHLHRGCKDCRLPATRTDWWREKLERNAARDVKNVFLRQAAGWRTVIVWTCALKRLGDPETRDAFVRALVSAITADPNDVVEFP